MRQSLVELCALLSEQKALLTDLYELSVEERQLIIKGDAENLDKIVRQKHRGISKLNAIEKERMAMLPNISAELGLPSGGGTTVSLVAKNAGADERKAISELQKELVALVDKHVEITNTNKELIKSHLEYADAMLHLVVDSEDPLNNFYGGDGKAVPERKKTTGFFDSQA
jgi:flagellar biosynthesis/type III secretory pathway chaperone